MYKINRKDIKYGVKRKNNPKKDNKIKYANVFNIKLLVDVSNYAKIITIDKIRYTFNKQYFNKI